jgi:hypothetical protein
MNVTIEAAPLAAEATMVEAVVTVLVNIIFKALSQIERVASIARPSLGSHSLSAVAPDSQTYERTLALGVCA